MNGKHKEKILAKNKEGGRTVWKWNIYPHIQQIFIQILIEFLLCARCLDACDISVNKTDKDYHSQGVQATREACVDILAKKKKIYIYINSGCVFKLYNKIPKLVWRQKQIKQ